MFIKFDWGYKFIDPNQYFMIKFYNDNLKILDM